jgi:hypothetical protein
VWTGFESFPLKAKSFKWAKAFIPLSLLWVGSGQFLLCPQWIFPSVLMHSTWLLFFLSVFSCCAGNQIQGLSHGRQMLYHWVKSPVHLASF